MSSPDRHPLREQAHRMRPVDDAGGLRSKRFCIVVLLGVATLALAQDVQDPSRSPVLHTVDPKTPEGLRELLRHDGSSLHLVGAHRGGPREGFPENCIATFEDTLRHTFAMMEVDPRYTRDGAIVLHHDATLDRTTNGTGRVADHTLAQLQALRLKDPKGHLTAKAMPTLDEALAWARGKTILVLDQKSVPVAARVRKIEEHRAEAYAIVIVYSLKDAKLCHAMNKDIMMEVMVTSREKFAAFDETGIPWSSIVAFVGHSLPQDVGLCRVIHARGACCMAGTSRNVDRRFIDRHVVSIEALSKAYRALVDKGVDIIETDLPREVGQLLYGGQPVPSSRARFLRSSRP